MEHVPVFQGKKGSKGKRKHEKRERGVKTFTTRTEKRLPVFYFQEKESRKAETTTKNIA